MQYVPLKALSDWREREGLNKARAAAKLDVPRATYFRWEKGARKIGLGSLPKVQQITGIPMRELRPDLAEVIAA